jgi:serine/threonine protein kinase
MIEIYLDEVKQTDDFNEYFTFLEYLGKGSFGKVIKAIYLKDGREVAVKVIDKEIDLKNLTTIKHEIEILHSIDHPNIVKFFSHIETKTKLFIIMEFVQGGTLKSLIGKRKIENIPWEEAESSLITKHLLSAIEYLHARDIVHRDIKPENIMLGSEKDLTTIKLIDFGLSALQFEDLKFNDNCGTFLYMAPEQLDKRAYTKSVDIWSCGIIMGMLLNNGNHPFYKKGQTSHQYVQKLKNPNFDNFKGKISKMSLLLLSKLLEVNMNKRFSAELANKHPWLTRNKLDKIPKTYQEEWRDRTLKTKFLKMFGSVLFLGNYVKANLLQHLNIKKSNTRNTTKFVQLYQENSLHMADYIKKVDKISSEERARYMEKIEKMFESNMMNISHHSGIGNFTGGNLEKSGHHLFKIKPSDLHKLKEMSKANNLLSIDYINNLNHSKSKSGKSENKENKTVKLQVLTPQGSEKLDEETPKKEKVKEVKKTYKKIQTDYNSDQNTLDVSPQNKFESTRKSDNNKESEKKVISLSPVKKTQ